MPTRAVNGGYIQVQFEVEENVSPAINTTLTMYKPRMAMALEELGQTIRQSVIHNFNMKSAEYSSGLSSVTRMAKHNSQALIDTGRLKNAVENAEVTMSGLGDSQTVNIGWTFPNASQSPMFPFSRQNQGYIYLWSHEQEFGMISSPKRLKPGKLGGFVIQNRLWVMKPRPFLMEGIQQGAQAGSMAAAQTLAPVMDLQTISMNTIVRYRPFDVPLTPSMIPYTLGGLVFWFVPPSKMYAVIGAVSDLAGAINGSFSERAAFGYGRQMAWGRTGVTKKSIRRRYRRRLWMRE
jgi:hypothetical protein